MKRTFLAMAAAWIALPTGLHAQQEVQLRSQQVGAGIYMITGQGGNIGVSVGADGAYIIDDQFAPLTEAIRAEIRKLTPEPVRFVLNTHWHFDHTGGNENFGEGGALIVAHDNVRARMSVDQVMEFFDRDVPAAPPAALPVITFDSAVTFHLNGGEIYAFHVQNAHTDGDAIVVFPDANVIHMGDTYFNGLYPFIDTGSGGSIDGVIKAVGDALVLIDENTAVIPGHGPVSNRAELVAYRDMLMDVRDRITAHVLAGLSLEEIQAIRPTRSYDAKWGQGFIPPDRWTALIHADLTD